MESRRDFEPLFGTDGVRGIPGVYPLVPDILRALARAAAGVFLERSRPGLNGSAPFVVLGRDTRGSGPALARTLAAGFSDLGVRVIDAGVIPSPGVSYLTSHLGAIGGVVISASHNPPEFNGVKLFDARGFKFDEDTERDIERRVKSARLVSSLPARFKLEKAECLAERYAEFLRSTFPAMLDLSGMRLAVDCSNGAASAIAPRLLESLGADVIAIGCRPNGRNINLGCGALFPDAMSRLVVKSGADCGISFDGDADRAIFADEKGALVDGDALIALSALRLKRLGLLSGGQVAVTVMSNFGLLRFLRAQGIGAVSVPVGDRNVSAAIEKEKLSLGGEASGHVIFRRFAATGDGILTALQTLAALRESGLKMSDHRKAFHVVPQLIHNVKTERKVPLERLSKLRAAIKRCESELAQEGRVFVRYSGTEPLLRIMIEGPHRSRLHEMAKEIEAAYRQSLLS